MTANQDAFFQELLADFRTEAAEHQFTITDGLLKLEKKSTPEQYIQIIETTYREFHSLKGAARAVNQLDIERICQTMESVFQQLKQGTLTLSPLLFDMVYKGVDYLSVMLSELDKTQKSITSGVYIPLLKSIENAIKIPLSKPKTDDIPETVFQFSMHEEKIMEPVAEPQTLSTEEKIAETKPKTLKSETTTAEKQTGKDTVRIATRKLESLLRQAEEFIAIKATLGYYIHEIQKSNHEDQTVIQRDLNQFHRNLSRMVDDLLFNIKSTLLYPFSSLLDIVPKIVRDLSKEFDKEINLNILGAETEIDRRILEAMKDPLIHLIRNCIDHGLETKVERKRKGKPVSGTIKIQITQEAGRQVVMLISDDGAGINTQKLIEKVVKTGLASAESISKMSDQEINAFIFRSGISTSQIITDLSGRGLGMAIVLEKVNDLGGSIFVTSQPDQGTTFTITLPLTLSTFRGVLVRVYDQKFIVPTTAVERAIRININEIYYAESKPFLHRNGESIALVNLGDTLNIRERKKQKDDQTQMPVLILSFAQNKIGFIIDEVVGEQEGIVKDLGPQLLHIKNIAGATLLGNGQVIPILSVPELMESAMNAKSYWSESKNENETESVAVQNILVAEDSITSRTLLRNILETAGYAVKTSVDGIEAFQLIQSEKFDLVVSDIEMPNMNGFELTSKIKNDDRFENIPVVLVTSLSSDFDKQRGMEAGANAYIVKSNFEQSKLVETIKRLI